jgi:photosystem II stability/assembly factor-like uncharacterized protein
MKNTAPFILAFVLAFASTCYLVKLPNSHFSESEKENDEGKSLSSKADDNYFAARSFPDAAMSISAYDNAMQTAKTMMETQSNQRSGFASNWTTEGPNNIGGRVNTIAVNPQNEQVIYIGFSRGGVFKTIDGGATWKPIFDKQPYLSIGDIELDPSNPNTIYVATGDPNIGYYSSIGDGVWKSTDAGATWTNIGLKNQRIISRFEVNPKNNQIMYAAAMGISFQKNKDRGVYKTTDGGATWTQKLFVSDSTGVCDFMMDPQNPNVIYASTWDRVRSNNTNIVAGNGAGVFKSTDGGDNWTKLSNGLPSGRFSRTGITMFEKNPNILFAVFVADKSFEPEGIYRSTNAGASWEKLSNEFKIGGDNSNAFGGFGWYFGQIRVNPKDANDIYLLGVNLWRSKDGGVTWLMAGPPWWSYEVHADKHDMAYTPSGKILLATDGGAYISKNDGLNWEDIENIAATQFYRVAYNPNEPSLYYGGAQDNGSTEGNQKYSEWDRLYGGDGFQTRFDPKRPDTRFYETQFGDIAYTTDNENFTGIVSTEISAERRHWDCPYFLSTHQDGIIYIASQRVWKGTYDPNADPFIVNWKSISNDLSDNDGKPGVGNSITTLEESTLEKNLLFAGTADANLWKSSGTNATWQNISAGLPNRYITKVLPSAYNKNTVFVSLSGYREFEETPHIWRSDNQGTNWKNISGDLPPVAINDILSLENNRDSVLFAATDSGVYFTKNGGKNWLRLGGNMPLIPVFDIEYNPVLNQIVAGTYARSIMSFDLKNVGLSNKPISSTKENLAAAKVSLYPALFDNHFTISSLEENITSVKIYDLQGKILLAQAQKEKQIVIENTNFTKGIYIVEITLENKKRVLEKIVKQ